MYIKKFAINKIYKNIFPEKKCFNMITQLRIQQRNV